MDDIENQVSLVDRIAYMYVRFGDRKSSIGFLTFVNDNSFDMPRDGRGDSRFHLSS